MIVEHKHTKQLYRVLLSSWDVRLQCAAVVYMQLETGAVFNRPADEFKKSFLVVVEDAQAHIIPKKARGWEHLQEMPHGDE